MEKLYGKHISLWLHIELYVVCKNDFEIKYAIKTNPNRTIASQQMKNHIQRCLQPAASSSNLYMAMPIIIFNVHTKEHD